MKKKYKLEYNSALLPTSQDKREAYQRMAEYGTWKGYWWTPNPSQSATSQRLSPEGRIRREGFVCDRMADDISTTERVVRLACEMVKASELLPSADLIVDASCKAIDWINCGRRYIGMGEVAVSLDDVTPKVGEKFGLEVRSRS